MERASRSRGFVSFQPAFLAHFTSCRYISRIFFPYTKIARPVVYTSNALLFFFLLVFLLFLLVFFFVIRNSSNLVQGDRKTKKKKQKKKDHAYRSSVFATALVFFVKYLYFICFLRGRLYPAWDTCFYTNVFTRIDCIFISQF